MQGGELSSPRLVLVLPVVVGEVASLRLHRHVLQHMVLLRDGDELILVLIREICLGAGEKGVGLQRMEYLGLLRGDVPCSGRELAVDAHIVGLAFLLAFLVLLLGVNLHLPLPVHEWKGEGVVSLGVRHGLARQALTLMVVQEDFHLHIIYGIPLPVNVQLAEHIELVLDGLSLLEVSLPRHQFPVVPAPPLREQQQVGASSMFFVVGLEVVAHVVDVASHLGAEQHPCLHVAPHAVGHGLRVHGGEGQGCVGLRLQLQLHLAAGLQTLRLGDDADAVAFIGIRADEEEPLGQYLALAVEDGELAHAVCHLLPVEVYLDEGARHGGVAVGDAAVVHQRVAYQAAAEAGRALQRGAHAVAHGVEAQRASLFSGFGKAEILEGLTVALLQVAHLEAQRAAVGRHIEETPAERVGMHGGEHVARLVQHEALA